MSSRHSESVFSWFGNFLLRFRWIIIILLLAMAAITIPGIPGLTITVNVEDFFLADDPVLQNQERFHQMFHNTDFIGVLVESDDIFSRDTLELIHRVGSELQEHVPLAGDVTSLVTFSHPSMGPLSLTFKDNTLLNSDTELEAIKEYFTHTEPLQETLFSRDGTEAWIHLTLKKYNSDKSSHTMFSVGKEAYNILQSIDTGNDRITPTGIPVYAHRKEAEMMQDLFVILAAGGVIALILSIIILHSIQGIIGTLLVIGFSVSSVFGIEGWLKMSTDSAFISVPILLAVGVSIGYTVHISRFFIHHYRDTGNRRESVIHAVSKSAMPVLFTAFTTIVALLSFVFVEIKPIRWVGVTSALAIAMVYLFSMTLFPIILSIGKNEIPTKEGKKKKDRWAPLLQVFAQWVGSHRAFIILIFSIITAVSIHGMSKLEVDFNAEKMTGTRMQHMKDQIHVGNSQIATTETLDLVVTLPKGSFDQKEYLTMIDTLESEISLLPLVRRTRSVVDIVKETHYYSRGRNSEYTTIPDNDIVYTSILSRLKEDHPEIVDQWTAKEWGTTRIFVELSEFSSKDIEQNVRKITQLIPTILPKDTEYFFSGSTYQMAMMNQYVTRGLIRSILTALLLITIIMIAVFRSIRMGLIAMIPNIIPVLVAGGIMGYMGIPLEFVTMTVAPMIMGLAVDDTIHLLWHLKEDIKDTSDFVAGVSKTFSVVGLAITETTVILCVTFLVLTFSKMNSIIYMGLFSSIGIGAAYLADVFITPVLMRLSGLHR